MAEDEAPVASVLATETTAVDAATNLLSEETTAKVLRQVDYYFSDSNLPRDKFLSEKVQEGDGYVSIALLCSFSRMRAHLGLSGDQMEPDSIPSEIVQRVASILRTSSLLNVSVDGEKVGRKVAIEVPEKAIAEVDARSLFASPLPWNITMDEVEAFFSGVGQVKSVRLRRYPNSKDFTGSVYVEFSSVEEAKRVLGEKLVFQGATLKLEFKTDYENRVKDEKQERCSYIREEELVRWGSTDKKHKEEDQGPKASPDDGYEKGLIVTLKVGPAREENDAGKEDGTADADKEGEELLRREDLKETLQKYGVIKYIDFVRGASTGYIRFERASEAARVVEASKTAGEKGLEMRDSIFVSFSALEGEEEKEYWEKLRAGQEKRRDTHQGWTAGGRGGGRFGRGGGGSGGRGGRFGGRFGGGRRGGRSGNGGNFSGGGSAHKRFREDDDGGARDNKVAKTE